MKLLFHQQGDKGDKGEQGLTTSLNGETLPPGIFGPPGPPGPPGKPNYSSEYEEKKKRNGYK